MSITNPILYPSVTRIPSTSGNESVQRPGGESPIKPGEFDQALKSALQEKDLGQISEGLKFSAHALQRLKERQIEFNPEMMSRMNDAITKASSKGVQDTLILTDEAALIVNVPNRTVITAMDRNNLTGNVFTNIDGAVIV